MTYAEAARIVEDIGAVADKLRRRIASKRSGYYFPQSMTLAQKQVDDQTGAELYMAKASIERAEEVLK